MKFHQLLILAAIFLTACSPQKYVYHFDTYDYNAGNRKVAPVAAVTPEQSPLTVNTDALMASTESQPALNHNHPRETTGTAELRLSTKVKSMTKAERKELRKELKKELKSLVKKDVKKTEGVDSVKRTKVFDTFAALALAFGVGGIVLITLANISNAFWIAGAIALAIGAVLFVKWVSDGNG